MPHISNQTHTHVTEMIKQLLGAWQNLAKENDALKDALRKISEHSILYERNCGEGYRIIAREALAESV